MRVPRVPRGRVHREDPKLFYLRERGSITDEASSCVALRNGDGAAERLCGLCLKFFLSCCQGTLLEKPEKLY